QVGEDIASARETDTRRCLGRFDVAQDNFRVALADAAVDAGVRMAVALSPFWNVRGLQHEGIDALTVLRDRRRDSPPDALPGRAATALGSLSLQLGRLDETRAAFEHALQVARTLGDDQLVAAALTDLTFLAYLEDDPTRALGYGEEAVTVAR